MKYSIEDQISELLKSGRITKATAEILTRHYAKQPEHFKEEMAAAPEEVNRAHLMRLIDLLEKKNEMRKTPPNPPQELSPRQENISEVSAQSSPASKKKAPVSSNASLWESEKEKLVIQHDELKKKYEALRIELAATKESQKESEEKAFEYAKKYADAEEERRRSQIVEESKKKALEEEHQKLLEEVHRTREGEKLKFEKSLEVRSSDLVALGQEKERLAKELERKHEEQSKTSARLKGLEESAAQAEGLKKRCADLEEELKKEKEMRAKIQAQFQVLEKTLLDLEKQINALS